MQSIRDQEEEGEHILSLDLQSVQTAALQHRTLQGRGYKTGATLRQSVHSNQGQVIAPSHWLSLDFFPWRIFFTCEWGPPRSNYMHWLFDSIFPRGFPCLFHILWRLRMWDCIWKGAGGWCQGGDQSQFRLSACSAAVHTADWCFIILSLQVSIFFIQFVQYPGMCLKDKRRMWTASVSDDKLTAPLLISAPSLQHCRPCCRLHVGGDRSDCSLHAAVRPNSGEKKNGSLSWPRDWVTKYKTETFITPSPPSPCMHRTAHVPGARINRAEHIN